MNITFENPWYLLLIPAVIILLIISMRFMLVQNKRAAIGTVIVRSILAIMLILALSQLSVKWVGKNVTTIFLVDVSDSVKEQRSEAIRFVNEAVKQKGKRDYIGVIAFGKAPRVEQYVDRELSFTEFQTDVPREATDLEEAVKIALAELPEESAKRIVLITDGNENEGDLRKTAANVVASGCDFQVLKLAENNASEVYVSDMNIPKEVGVGENFNINVEVESNVACSATVSLYSGRTLKGQQQVNLQKGTNRFVFKDTQTDEGLKTYRVTVDALSDTVSVNNEFSSFTSIEVAQPLLIVEGEAGNAEELKHILNSMGKLYDVVAPSTVPNTMSDFMEYGGIIFIDVYADDLREGFTEHLKDYVKNYGGGFVATGGKNSFALGNYRDTPIEEVLPVYMELQGENEVPVMAMQLVIDQSGSMSDGNGFITNLDLAKEAANAAVENVRESDYIGVMSFDDNFDKVVPLQLATDKDAISQSIFTIGIDGGTSIYPALLEAATDVTACDAMVKHILLLTDGQDGMSNSDYDELIEQINRAGITLSTVAVGTGCNTSLMEYLAESCNGRSYMTDINSDIPRIFAQEVFLSSNTYLVNEEFTPVVTANDVIIRDVAADGLPNLLGYVATTPKERSIEVLQSPSGDPILAYWQYGLGKSVAWTSDVTGEWSSNYSGWENTPLLWHNIIEYLTTDMTMDGTFTEVVQNGSHATIKYKTEKYDGNTEVTATIYDDAGQSYDVELDPLKPGEYEVEIPTDKTGIYTINVKQLDGGEIVSSTNTAAIMQYSMEYRFYPDNTLLEEYIASVGGVFVEEAAQVFATQPEHVKSRWNLATPLLVLATLFFLVDIAFRRFHIDWTKIFAMAGTRKKKESVVQEQSPEKHKKKKADKQPVAEQPSYVSQLSGLKKEAVMPQTTTQTAKPKQQTPVAKPVQKGNTPEAAKTTSTTQKAATVAAVKEKNATQVKVWKRNEEPKKETKTTTKESSAPANNRLDTKALLNGLKERE